MPESVHLSKILLAKSPVQKSSEVSATVRQFARFPPHARSSAASWATSCVLICPDCLACLAAATTWFWRNSETNGLTIWPTLLSPSWNHANISPASSPLPKTYAASAETIGERFPSAEKVPSATTPSSEARNGAVCDSARSSSTFPPNV